MKRLKYFLIGVGFFVLVVAASYVIPTDPLPINTTACVLPSLFCIIPIVCFTFGYLYLNGPESFREWNWEMAQNQYKRANMELTREDWENLTKNQGWAAIACGIVATIFVALLLLGSLRR